MTNADGDAVHFAFPFTRGTYVVHGSPDHTFSQVQVVARYPKGLRHDNPEFGITFPEFDPAPLDAVSIAAEIKAQVPHAEIEPDEYADAIDTGVRHVLLTVRHGE